MLVIAAEFGLYQWDEAKVVQLAECEYGIELTGTFAQKLVQLIMYI